MADLPELLPHRELREIFPDIFVVTGMMRMGGQQPKEISRNMTVVREGEALTLINVVRLSDEGLAVLDGLGTVTNLVKLGSYHGRDDAFYVQRYPDATMWAPPDMPHYREVVTDCELGPDSVPISDAELFVYETSNNVEALLLLHREGGILIPCDSLQNWETPDEYFDEAATETMAKFIGRATVGAGWLKYAEPKASDFERLSAMRFQHLLPSHGTPLLNDAGTELRATFARVFGIRA